MNEVLRQEKKYLLTMEQYRIMDNYFEKLLHTDEHNGTNGYMVRSLYFDTLQDQDYEDKQDGLETRKKIRLRIYDTTADFGLLEMKQKQGDNQKKRSLKISRKDAEALARGSYHCLLKYEDPFAKECYALMNVLLYRPKAIVEYRRKAYIAAENKTRITFDTAIKATESNFDIFSSELSQYPVLDPYLTVMEVKYNGFLLSYIKDVISMEGKIPTSVSKYSLSRSVGKHFLF